MKENGFYHDGIWNSVIETGGKKLRHRVEIIVFQDHQIFCDVKPDGTVRFPGGSTEPDCDPIVQVINELHEEALINAVNVTHMDSMARFFGPKLKRPKWMDNLPVKYDGYFNDLYCGIYAGKYNGAVENKDRDESMANNGKFVAVDVIFPKLEVFYQTAILRYQKAESENFKRYTPVY